MNWRLDDDVKPPVPDQQNSDLVKVEVEDEDEEEYKSGMEMNKFVLQSWFYEPTLHIVKISDLDPDPVGSALI